VLCQGIYEPWHLILQQCTSCKILQVNGVEPSTVSHILLQAQQWKGGVGSNVFVINKTLELLKLEKFKWKIILFDLFQPFINLYFFVYRLFRRKENYTYRYENR